MSIVGYIRQADWAADENRKYAEAVFTDACEYWRRVIDHIYKGNEIRADEWMDFSEKQEEIKRLDRKRTEAHNRLLISAADLIGVLDRDTEFDRSAYRLANRTQIADFIATIAFELMDMKPSSTVEGNIRDELAEKMGMPSDKIRDIQRISQDPVSIDKPVGEEEDSHLVDFISSDEYISPDEEVSRDLLKEDLIKVLDKLTDREAKVIRLRFGLDDDKQRTLEEVGKSLGVTRERIRQIEAKAIRKLGRSSDAKRLEGYAD